MNMPVGKNFILMSNSLESSKVIVLHIDALKIYNIQTQMHIKLIVKIFPMEENLTVTSLDFTAFKDNKFPNAAKWTIDWFGGKKNTHKLAYIVHTLTQNSITYKCPVFFWSNCCFRSRVSNTYDWWGKSEGNMCVMACLCHYNVMFSDYSNASIIWLHDGIYSSFTHSVFLW